MAKQPIKEKPGDFNRLVELSIKLQALMLMTYGGEAGESFRDTHAEIQDAYLWACSDMATEIKEIVDRLEVSHG